MLNNDPPLGVAVPEFGVLEEAPKILVPPPKADVGFD